MYCKYCSTGFTCPVVWLKVLFFSSILHAICTAQCTEYGTNLKRQLLRAGGTQRGRARSSLNSHRPAFKQIHCNTSTSRMFLHQLEVPFFVIQQVTGLPTWELSGWQLTYVCVYQSIHWMLLYRLCQAKQVDEQIPKLELQHHLRQALKPTHRHLLSQHSRGNFVCCVA